MTLGSNRAIITLQRGPWLVVVIACKTCFTLVNDPDDHIRMAYVDYPDVLWSGCITKVGPYIAPFNLSILPKNGRVKIIGFLKRRLKKCLPRKLSHLPGGEAREKATDKLDVKEFGIGSHPKWCDRGVLNEEVLCLEKSKERPSPSPKSNSTRGFDSLCRRCSRNSSTSPRFHPPSSTPISSGYVRSPALPSIGEGAARLDEGGQRDMWWFGCMGGAFGASFEALLSKLFLSPEKRGHIVDWVEKASFACLNKLFEIDAKERHYKTLPKIMSSIFSPGSCQRR
ncbi:hypothetical protein AAG906_000916 [Vitis piasezkii]